MISGAPVLKVRVEGRITPTDFFVPSMNATAAELDPARKNAGSHRAIALQQLLARLKEFA